MLQEYLVVKKFENPEIKKVPITVNNKIQKIIYWIDDEPIYNENIIRKHFLPHQIKTYQITSTLEMNNIIKK